MLSLTRTVLITVTIVVTAAINFSVPLLWLGVPSLEKTAFFMEWPIYSLTADWLAQYMPAVLAKPFAAAIILSLVTTALMFLWTGRATHKKLMTIAKQAGFGSAFLGTLKTGDLPTSVHLQAKGLWQFLSANPDLLPAGTFIHVFHSPAFNAVAFTDLKKSRHIVISTGVLESVAKPEHLAFVLLHEVGHIERNHSFSALLMVSASIISRWAERAAGKTAIYTEKTMRGLSRFPLPFLRLLDFFAFVFVSVFNAFSATNQLLFSLLLVVDKAISRRMEFEADEYAATHSKEIADGGIDVLKALTNSFDWFPSLSGTHPSNRARVSRIRRLMPH